MGQYAILIKKTGYWYQAPGFCVFLKTYAQANHFYLFIFKRFFISRENELDIIPAVTLKVLLTVLSNAFTGQREMSEQEIESKGVDQHNLQNPGKNHRQSLSGFP